MSAARISLILLIVAAVWIVASDALVNVIAHDDLAVLTTLQTLKGWGFGIVVIGLLYFLLKREFEARLRSEQKALEGAKQFRHLFANNPVPMWVYDLQTLGFLDVNEAACALYGFDRDEFLKMKITDIRPSEELPRLMNYLQSTNPDFRSTAEWRHLKKDRQMIDVETTAHTLDYAGQQAVLVAVKDITKRKRLQAEYIETENLRLRLVKEAEMDSMRTRFVSMVSHEFRRPLTTITTSIDLLENYRDRMNDEAAKKHFDRIHERLREMQDLVDDFLTLMNTEVAQQAKPSSFDLTELCAKLVEEARLSAKPSHTLRYTTDCAKIVVYADEKMLRHAIGNLLSNAVKYSPNGGIVAVELRRCEDLQLRISDQGIGIPPEDQINLFDPFYRASNVGDLHGTGLGLPIAKQSVEQNGGTLSITRSDSSGTEFLITLPVDERTFLTGC